jgi:hypothetical protein
MAYKQYTICTSASDHVEMNQYIQATLWSLIPGGLISLLLIVSGMPWCILLALLMGAAAWVIAYCHWWLHDRLICLGGKDDDRIAIGMLVAVNPPNEKTGFDAIDTDYSVNLLLMPNLPTDTRQAIETSSPYGHLVKEQDSTKAEGLPFTSFPAVDTETGIESTVLHAEFEGGGVDDMLLGAQVGFFIAGAALIVCMAVPFPLGAVLAAILAALALLAMLLGLLLGLKDPGSPTDVDPSLGDLHKNDASGTGADILVVSGTWVYDSGHNNQGEGWNEIHPVKHCQIAGTWEGKWPDDPKAFQDEWEDKIAEAKSPLTIADQKRPQSQWQAHPLVDGCGPEDEPPH